MKEYRVVWKRKDWKIKRRIYQTRKGADRFLRIFGPKPWEAFNLDPDELYCCSGDHCACGGTTVRERFDAMCKDIPPLEFARIEEREVGKWSPKGESTE